MKNTHIYIILLTLLVPSLLKAQESEWSYRLTPYVWLPSLHTDLAIGPNQPVGSDTALLDVLDFAFLISGEAWKDDWGILAEFNYLGLSQDSTFAGELINFETSLDGYMSGLAYAHRMTSSDKLTSDIFVGIRYWSLEAEIDFQQLQPVSKDINFLDPIVGIRGKYQINDKYYMGGIAEIGGFGVGSEFQWELVANLGYHYSESSNWLLGYRHLALDFDDDGLVMDAQMSGPYFALDFTW